MVADSAVLLDRPAAGVLRITVNRPSTRNALTSAMVAELTGHLAAAAQDETVGAVVLAGAGAGFCSGYDLKELGAGDPGDRDRAASGLDTLLWSLAQFPKPTVAAVCGAARGGGSLLALCADLRVADADTTLALSAVHYGGAALTWLLGDLIGYGRARDLLLTGRVVRGEEAERIGLVSRLVAPGAVPAAAVELAADLAAAPPGAVREISRLLCAAPGRGVRSRFDDEVASRAELLRQAPEGAFGSPGRREDRPREQGPAPRFSWDDPFEPTTDAEDPQLRMVRALGELQEAVTRADPTDDQADAFADWMARLAGELRRFEVSEDDQPAGKRWEVAGRGQALVPPVHLVEVSPTRVRGHVTIGRFHSGRYAMNGGVTPLIFDELLARLANGFGRPWGRTAYLKVDYRAPAPLGEELTLEAELTGEEGRKRYLSGAMYHGDVLLAEAEGLWVQVREGTEG